MCENIICSEKNPMDFNCTDETVVCETGLTVTIMFN